MSPSSFFSSLPSSQHLLFLAHISFASRHFPRFPFPPSTNMTFYLTLNDPYIFFPALYFRSYFSLSFSPLFIRPAINMPFFRMLNASISSVLLFISLLFISFFVLLPPRYSFAFLSLVPVVPSSPFRVLNANSSLFGFLYLPFLLIVSSSPSSIFRYHSFIFISCVILSFLPLLCFIFLSSPPTCTLLCL